MFRKHVSHKLSAYCHGELTADETRQVAEHLLACGRCRGEHEEIRLGVRLAESLPPVQAPDSLWHEIEAALDALPRRPARRPFALFSMPGWAFATAAAVVVVGVTVAALVYRRQPPGPPRPSWEVERVEGAPRTDAGRIREKGRLAVGEWLTTDKDSRAKITVADIGHVEVAPNTRVGLVATRATEHRLDLKRGRLEATIKAAPRIFIVDTPSATAVDLGCAYTLTVDNQGHTFLHVTSGWVALMRGDKESFVPIGAMCETRPDVGPGTPYFADASDRLKDALARFDFEEGGDAALGVVLAESRSRDTFTLWHLIQRVDEARRAVVLDRMIQLVPLPEGVTRQGIMRLDKDMLEYWKEEFDLVWF